MYGELVKELRDSAEWADRLALLMGRAEGDTHAPIMRKAADAIEELQQYAEIYKDGGEAAKKAVETYKAAYIAEHDARVAELQRWIPVTERLPCLTTPVLVTDGIEVDIAWMYGVPPRWITSYTAIDEDKLTHWMPLPQTPKEK